MELTQTEPAQEERQTLLDWIRDHDILFNKKSSDYKDTVKKDGCCGEIASKGESGP